MTPLGSLSSLKSEQELPPASLAPSSSPPLLFPLSTPAPAPIANLALLGGQLALSILHTGQLHQVLSHQQRPARVGGLYNRLLPNPRPPSPQSLRPLELR